VKLTLVDLLRNPTPRTLAGAIATASGSEQAVVVGAGASRGPRRRTRRRRGDRAPLDAPS
jgi:hypothetical protein